LKEAAGAAKKGPSEAVAIMRPWYVSLNINATRPRSREFIEFLKLLDAAYPAHTAIKLILDNHSAHISLKVQPLAWRSFCCTASDPSDFLFLYCAHHLAVAA
jgi:hypothetical protein